jgi:hypothetical protein
MKCGVCSEAFAGDTAFSLHRVGEMPTNAPVGEASKYRRCLTPFEMMEKGMRRDGRGRWMMALAWNKRKVA